MNASFRDIFAWILSLDPPSISVIWNWLISVPWWVAVLTICLTWVILRGAFYMAWSLYAWLCDKADSLGQHIRKGRNIAKLATQRALVNTRAFGRWLLQLLAIR